MALALGNEGVRSELDGHDGDLLASLAEATGYDARIVLKEDDCVSL